MSFKDILAMLVAEDNAGVINCAQRVAQRVGGAASALLFEVEPAPIYVYGSYEGYVSGDLWQKVVAEARTAFLDSERKVKAQLTALPQEISLEERHVLAMEVAAQAALAARYRDLIVMARPDAAMSAAQRGIVDSVLFESGRPVLLAPPGWEAGAIGRTIAVGWNAKREAAQALSAAAPLIDRADKVIVLTVDARPGAKGHGDMPGADIAAHLARRGVPTEIVNVQSGARSDGAALMEASLAANADMLVIGAYGHSRIQQFVLGGVTRELMADCPIPLFMTH